MRRLCGMAGSLVVHAVIALLLVTFVRPGQLADAPGTGSSSGITRTFVVSAEALAAEPDDQVLSARLRRRLQPLRVRRSRSRTRSSSASSTTRGRAASDGAASRRSRSSRPRNDADRGRVPDVIRGYLDQNLLQPYYDTDTRDPRFWAMLACVADHVEFIDWVRSFARKHPSSRTTTELLFLLDEFAEGSRDTLLMLLETEPEHDLAETRATNPRAFDLAVSIRVQYGQWLVQHDVTGAAAIRRRYDDIRLQLLSTILRTTPNGYRASDARYLMGKILFNQNNLPEALRAWRGISFNPRDSYAASYSELLTHFRRGQDPSAAEINRILGAEHRRWLDFSGSRLHQFGFTFDRF